MKHPYATPMGAMRLLLLTLWFFLPPVLANEIPEEAEVFDRGEVLDRETKTLDEWMEEYGEALPPREPRLPEPPQQANDPAPTTGEPPAAQPTGEDFSGELQPFAVTLVDKTLVEGVRYTVTGCAPNQAIPMRDNGEAPDTRAGDGEYTAMSTLCPFGSTPVVVLEDDTPLWQESYQPTDNTSAPSLRLLKTASGVSIDDGSEKPPPPPNNAQPPPEEAQSELLEPVTQTTYPAGSGLIWLLAGIAVGYGARSLQYRRKATSGSLPSTGQNTKKDAPPSQAEPLLALSVDSGLAKQKAACLSIPERQAQRSLTLSLAQHFAKEGRVLLVPHPHNQTFYPKQIPKTSDVIWFRGKPPRVGEIKDVLSDRDSPIVCTIIEGREALTTSRGATGDLSEQLAGLSDGPLLLIQLEDEPPLLADAQRCVVCEDQWMLDK